MNVIELWLAFIEGLALIVSPCILPVLPLVLGASVTGGKRRPFGIITGFVLSFTAFAMLSRKLVAAFGVDLELIKNGSLVFLALFGLILISEKLSDKFSMLTQNFANIGTRISSKSRNEGYLNGILIGLLIGLVWTPCAGPILAAVLVQVIRQESDFNALLLVASFAIGAGIPMLLIALTGRRIMSKLGFFVKHAAAVRKTFGVIILIAVALIASGYDTKLLAAAGSGGAASGSKQEGIVDALPNPYKAPEFTGINSWLNSDPLTIKGLKGKVVLIDFWTYSCINCIRTLPYITKWDEKYRDKGLVIIGMHSPEFEFEKTSDNVAKALEKYGIKYPVAQDNNLDTWVAFNNRFWPAHYLIDKDGKVVYTHFGEGNYIETENNIRYLLGLDMTDESDNFEVPFSREQTPETYLGFARADNFASPEAVKKIGEVTYSFPAFLPSDHWALQGNWVINAESILATKADAALQINFTAGKVFLVLGSSDGKPIDVTVKLNGAIIPKAIAGADVKEGIVHVDGHTLYELVSQKEVKNALLELTASRPGLEAYAFTFGK